MAPGWTDREGSLTVFWFFPFYPCFVGLGVCSVYLVEILFDFCSIFVLFTEGD